MFSHIITYDLSLPCRLGLSLICAFICGRVLTVGSIRQQQRLTRFRAGGFSAANRAVTARILGQKAVRCCAAGNGRDNRQSGEEEAAIHRKTFE
jgi:hypothetical protein